MTPTPTHTPDAMAEVAADIKRMALEIFDGPECSQDVRDAIEWFASELSTRSIAPHAGKPK